MSKAIEKAKTKELATVDPNMFADDAGKGMEGTDKDSYAIPFITLLQGLSPQLETVEAAKPGLFINTITNEISKTLRVVPCAFQRRYLRWAPRSSGGGFKGEYDPVEVETGKVPGVRKVDNVYLCDAPENATLFDKDGHPLFDRLNDTRNHFVLAESADGVWKPALISLSSTQIKKSKRWMARIGGIEMKDAKGKVFVPPSFSHVYVLSAVKEENNKGSWWSFEIDMDGPVASQELYSKAKEFHASVAAGKVEVSPPVEPATQEGF